MWRRLAAPVAVLLLALASDARGDALSDARTAVEGSDYPTARTTLERALQAGTASPAELAEIYKLRGIVEAALGNANQATAAFASWLALDPKGSLPAGTSPKIVRPFTAAQQELKDKGAVVVKAETETSPPAVTLVVVSDPTSLIVGARVHFIVDGRGEQTLEADGTDRIKLELETGKRLDLRLHAVDRFGNRVAELGTKDVPLVITSSGAPTPIRGRRDEMLETSSSAPASPRPLALQWWVWGIATGVTAGVSGVFAWRTHAGMSDLDRLNRNSLVHTWSEAQDVESRTRRDLLVTNITAGVAGVLAIGTTLLYFTRPRTAEAHTRAAVTPLPGGGAIVLGGQF